MEPVLHARFSGRVQGDARVGRLSANSGLEESLLHLIKLRAWQINGCAYCLDMHCKDLRAIGENEQRLYSLDTWRECPYYPERERAALAWTEAVTLVAQDHVPDEVYEAVRPRTRTWGTGQMSHLGNHSPQSHRVTARAFLCVSVSL